MNHTGDFWGQQPNVLYPAATMRWLGDGTVDEALFG